MIRMRYVRHESSSSHQRCSTYALETTAAVYWENLQWDCQCDFQKKPNGDRCSSTASVRMMMMICSPCYPMHDNYLASLKASYSHAYTGAVLFPSYPEAAVKRRLSKISDIKTSCQRSRIFPSPASESSPVQENFRQISPLLVQRNWTSNNLPFQICRWVPGVLKAQANCG